MPEIRVSPDGSAVAISTGADGRTAWGVMHVEHGGSWAPASVVDGWTVLAESD